MERVRRLRPPPSPPKKGLFVPNRENVEKAAAQSFRIDTQIICSIMNKHS